MAPEKELDVRELRQVIAAKRRPCARSPELFFSPDRDRQAGPETRQERRARVRAAKRVCFACPVRAACLEYALRNRESYGVWGGLTFRQRVALTAGLGVA